MKIERYGATLSGDLPKGAAVSSGGATITRDIEVWPRKVATDPALKAEVQKAS